MTGTALEQRKQDQLAFRGRLRTLTKDLATIARHGIRTDDIIALTLEASSGSPAILQCTDASIYRALTRCAKLGLTIGEDVHLVPMRHEKRNVLELQAWIGYKGLKRALKRANVIRDMWERCVFEKEHFAFEYGLEETFTHKPLMKGDPGDLVGAYSVIQLPFGRKTFHYMSIDDIEAIRRGSKQWSPTKVKACPPWYAMKTVVLDWGNRQPLTADVRDVFKMDDTADDQEPPEGVTDDGEIVDGEYSIEEGDAHE